MVFICPEQYNPADPIVNSYLQLFPYELSDWQKWSLHAIISGNHTLVTAPTGSGKTLPAEFTIQYFKKLGKKVIYTSPIKALSNQKFYDFTNKYPDISFGLLTGDIKTNPDADVLIMTTEILRNNLYQAKSGDDTTQTQLDFEINIENDVGAIIFDEVHYINDADRGTVWEECFMLIPPIVQLVMLSATIDTPSKFASWIQNIHSNKEVFLSTTEIRAVPLKHHYWFSCNASMLKLVKDKTYRQELERFIDKPHAITNGSNQFDEPLLHTMKKHITYLQKNNMFVKRQHVLNRVTDYLKKNDLLPAIFFVYSRVNAEKYAEEINFSLLDGYDDAHIPSIIHKECQKVLMKLPNYIEYMNLPEYVKMVKLLEKGIAVHHSGILPVLREMIEMMFDKGYIKLLIATETFAVGLNMPTKTVVFTNLTKFDGSTSRYLMSHEYTQQAGRAGRRGYDTKGVVIHLNNMFALPTPTEYRHILSGTPQKLVSKFKISFNMILNMQYMKMEHVDTFAKKSILNSDISNQIKGIQNHIEGLDTQIVQNKQFTTNLRTSKEDIMKTIELEKAIHILKNKHRKNAERELASLKDMNKYMTQDRKVYDSLFKFEEEKKQVETQLERTESYISESSNKVALILKENHFIEEDNSISITGKVACNIQEIHCLAFSDTLLYYNYFAGFTYQEIVGVLSCFTNVKVGDDYKAFTIETDNTTVKSTINYISKRLEYYYDQEVKNVVVSGSDYTIHYDLINYMMEWCECSNEIESKLLIQKLQTEKSVFLGEFIKSILKVNNIANELEKIANYMENVELLSKLNEIKNNTLKFVATTQSLYV